MTHPLRVICRPAVRDGFALAGVRCLTALDGIEAAAVLNQLLLQPQPGVLLVEESLYEALPEALRSALESHVPPLVIPFPGPGREDLPSPEIQLVELLRQAIGYRVRL